MTSLSILLLGGTGTIGRATAQALRAEGHQVTAVIRPSADASHLSGCTLIRGEVTPDTLAAAMPDITAVVSCLASRTGAPKDAWAVDHAANSGDCGEGKWRAGDCGDWCGEFHDADSVACVEGC